jgi:hypothetical protein
MNFFVCVYMYSHGTITPIFYIREIVHAKLFSVLFKTLKSIIFMNNILVLKIVLVRVVDGNPYSSASSALDLILFSTSFKISTFVSYEIAFLLCKALSKMNMKTSQFSILKLMRWTLFEVLIIYLDKTGVINPVASTPCHIRGRFL